MRVLVLNPGSSTLKASLVDGGARDATDALVEWPAGDGNADAVVRSVLEQLPHAADAVGYRVVHGGMRYRMASHVDAELLTAVEELDALAPLHNRRAAAVMRAGLGALPAQAHVACFDTAFHATLPEEAWRYPLPAEWVERWGIRRFGFHGLSVAWSTRRAAELLQHPPGEVRLVVAHLGSGCSITTVDRGRSVGTSMGFTPFEGPMMGTRSGSVDPGILFHLLKQGLTPDDLADGIAHRSGLAAIAGTSSARDIEERAERGDPPAALALDMFVGRAAAAIGSAATTLRAVDALVFTGGIGEHSDRIRRRIVERLAPLGFQGRLDAVGRDGVAAAGPPAVLVVEAREDLVIAAEVTALLDSGPV